jgi:hypothetical protein
MRRICLILLVSAFAAPVAALAADRTSSEGSLVFSDANGTIVVRKGVIFGHFDQGADGPRLQARRPNASITVSGSKVRADGRPGPQRSDIRFLFPSGRYTSS